MENVGVKQKYGAVYTPETLSDFVAELLKRTAGNSKIRAILDPASGEGALLKAVQKRFGGNRKYIGIDVDSEAVNRIKTRFNIYHNDSILPKGAACKSAEYWRNELPKIDAVIANPPWSSERIYDREKLKSAGFSIVSGQYDSYVLFIELAYNVLREGGLFAFIIPDSLFDVQNVSLRKFLTEKTQIRIIARLGEKIFDEVNRATTVIICKKRVPNEESETVCFRLATDDRKAYLCGKRTLISYFDEKCHTVKQIRFSKSNGYHFDIDTHANEERLLEKITAKKIDWDSIFLFGRGVEISKTGQVVNCPHCGLAQGYKKKQLEAGKKKCTNCGTEIILTYNNIYSLITQKPDKNRKAIIVGENVHRYALTVGGYIFPDINGINYKDKTLYDSPKLLIRKTGLGIYCSIDYSGYMTSQTVYILKYIDNNTQTPLEYYLALINSRVVYYYYLKVFGENEWKSHPYLTKQIIFSFPLKRYTGSKIDIEIVRIAKQILKQYDYKLDLKLEKLIMNKYRLTSGERQLIVNEMNKLPNLGAVNMMKMEA